MQLRKTALAASLLTALSFSVNADDVQVRLDNQDQRLDLLEQKMDQILDLMISQTQGSGAQAAPAAKAASPAVAAPQAAPASYQQGLILDVYQIDPPERNKYPQRIRSENDFAVGRLLHESDATLGYSAFKKREDLISLGSKDTGKLLAQEFKGAIQITVPGQYILVTEMKRSNDDRTGSGRCTQTLTFDSERVATIYSNTRVDHKVENIPIALEPGLYDFSVWQVCTQDDRSYGLDRSKISATVKLKAPGDWEPTVIPAERLFYLP